MMTKNYRQRMRSYCLPLCLYLFSCAALGLSVDDLAPPFSLPDLRSGTSVSLQDYQGSVIYLDFWTANCPPCRQSFPFLASLHQRYQDQGFLVLSVNLDTNLKDAYQFLRQQQAPYPVLQGNNAALVTKYELTVMPTAFLIDANGKIRAIHQGFHPSHSTFINDTVQKLLAERTALKL